MAKHVMTARRRAALRKAQMASARKRRKGGSRKDRVRAHFKRNAGNYGAAAAYGTYIGAYSYIMYGDQIKRGAKNARRKITSNSKQRANPISRARTNRQFRKMVKNY